MDEPAWLSTSTSGISSPSSPPFARFEIWLLFGMILPRLLSPLLNPDEVAPLLLFFVVCPMSLGMQVLKSERMEGI